MIESAVYAVVGFVLGFGVFFAADPDEPLFALAMGVLFAIVFPALCL